MTEHLFRDDPYARSCETAVTSVDARGIRLARTVFYPAGGGQPGDTGVLRLADGSAVPIVDTQKGEAADEVIHVPAPGAPLPPPGAAVTAEIDWARRHRHMRFHTCLAFTKHALRVEETFPELLKLPFIGAFLRSKTPAPWSWRSR